MEAVACCVARALGHFLFLFSRASKLAHVANGPFGMVSYDSDFTGTVHNTKHTSAAHVCEPCNLPPPLHFQIATYLDAAAHDRCRG
jgi:hypothetical protein